MSAEIFAPTVTAPARLPMPLRRPVLSLSKGFVSSAARTAAALAVVLPIGMSSAIDAAAQRPDVLPIVASVSARAVRPIGLRDSLDRASGQGIAVRIDVWPERRVGLRLGFDADAYRLRTPGTDQTLGRPQRVLERGDAVDRWDWAHRERSYNNSNGVRGLDSTFAAVLRPIERAGTLSFVAAPALHTDVGRVAVTASAGPVGVWSRRRLFLRESWARTFPAITDSTTGQPYVYRYTFDNDAPDKTAMALGLDAGLSGRVRLTRLFHLVGGVSYRRYLWQRSRTDSGLEQVRVGDEKGLPFNDVLGFELGIALR